MSEDLHYPMDVLALWVLHAESAELDPGMGDHVAACLACAAAADALRRLAEETGPALTPIPKDLTRRIQALVNPGPAGDTAFLVARLIEDTRELAGVRGEADDGRFLLFEAAGHEIVIQMVPGTGGFWEIRGQLHSPASASVDGVRVRALEGARILGECETGDGGEISMSVPALPYRLELSRGALRIRTPEIH
jgi:hypothetical protein